MARKPTMVDVEAVMQVIYDLDMSATPTRRLLDAIGISRADLAGAESHHGQPPRFALQFSDNKIVKLRQAE